MRITDGPENPSPPRQILSADFVARLVPRAGDVNKKGSKRCKIALKSDADHSSVGEGALIRSPPMHYLLAPALRRVQPLARDSSKHALPAPGIGIRIGFYRPHAHSALFVIGSIGILRRKRTFLPCHQHLVASRTCLQGTWPSPANF